MKLSYKKVLGIAACGSATLGFVRGYKITKYNGRGYENFYVDRVMSGLFNSLMYVNPFLLVPIVVNDIKRIEIQLRGLDPKNYSNVYEEFVFRDYTDAYELRLEREERERERERERNLRKTCSNVDINTLTRK